MATTAPSSPGGGAAGSRAMTNRSLSGGRSRPMDKGSLCGMRGRGKPDAAPLMARQTAWAAGPRQALFQIMGHSRTRALDGPERLARDEDFIMSADPHDIAEARRRYAASLARGGPPQLERAFAQVPREDFLPAPPWRIHDGGGAAR